MFRWAPYVFVRLTIVFIAGILLAIYHPSFFPQVFTICALVVLVFGYGTLYWFKHTKSLQLNLGPLGLIIIFLGGYLLLCTRTEVARPDHFIHLNDTIQSYEAVIVSYPQEKDKSWKVEARMAKARFDRDWRTVNGKVLLYFSREHFPKPFSYGDKLIIKGHPQVLTAPANPAEFDYKRFLSFRNITHQHFLKKHQVALIENNAPFVFMVYAFKLRLWADASLHQFIKGDKNQAIASALVLGVTDGLDNEIMHAYSATGAMHVLAVSGLHVGIIYGILLLLLKPLAKRRTGPWIVAVVSLIILWMYALITGLSPSVLRAVTMFSFVALARPLRWSTNIYNTLAASAFMLLLYDPYLIMSVGFQLSYAAVLGIVYWQRPIYMLWTAPSFVTDKIWQITTVSIAAQLATVSLGLLYFHQFPVYFLFSNLFVIPISFIVLILGLLVLLFSFISPVASMIGWLLAESIEAMNGVVILVERMPFSLLDNLYITTLQSWIIMGLLIAFFLLIRYKRFYFLLTSFLFALILSCTHWYHYYKSVNQVGWTVYNVGGYTAIDFMNKGRSYFLGDSALMSDKERMRFHIRPNRLVNEIKSTELMVNQPFYYPAKDFAIVQWHGKSILILNRKHARLPSLQVDVVVIGNNAISLTKLVEKINFDQVILDSSNSFYFATQSQEDARLLNREIHSVLHQGSFSQVL